MVLVSMHEYMYNVFKIAVAVLSDMSLVHGAIDVRIHIVLNSLYRYKKQRNQTPGNDVIVKFLPIPLAVIMANIALRVKPIEAAFAFSECGADVLRTTGVLFTKNGIPIDPGRMATILSQTWAEFELEIGAADLRHALEAFAHKFPNSVSVWNPSLVAQANHGMETSARYARDDNSFVGIPANISEANFRSCHDWNMVILDSPSMISEQLHAKITRQLQELGLIGSPSMISDQLQGRITGQLQELRLMSQQPSPAIAHMLMFPGSVDRDSKRVVDSDMSHHVAQAWSSGQPGSTQQPQSCAIQLETDIQVQHTELATKSAKSEISEISQETQPVKQRRTEDQIQQNRLVAQKRLKALSTLRPMQIQALQFLEGTGSSAFVIMPTASGKTTLIYSHRKDNECSVVFAPYNLLCGQLLSLCKEKGVAEAWPLQAFNGSVEAMLLTLQFAIFPYEAATQAHTFIAALHRHGRLGPIWVDEVRYAQLLNSQISCTFRYTRWEPKDGSGNLSTTSGILVPI
jgi:hypothetical protein